MYLNIFIHLNFILLLPSLSCLSCPTQLANLRRTLSQKRTRKNQKKKNTVIKSSSYNCNNVTLANVTHKRCTADAIDFSAPSPISRLTSDVSASSSSIPFGLQFVRPCVCVRPSFFLGYWPSPLPPCGTLLFDDFD